jgi:urease accessory protein
MSPTEIVAINTAGGLTGGDALDLTIDVAAGARAIVTTPACEKIYRAADGEAAVTSIIRLAPGSALDWLPQPMILFDGARITRRLDVDMASDATLLAVEGVILGRTAMEEDVRSGTVRDTWRVHRDGRLIYGDAFRSEGDMRTALASGPTLASGRAFATVLHVAPDAASRVEAARALLDQCACETGASAWNGMLVVRFLGCDGQTLVSDLAAFLSAFRGQSLPRSWLC